MNDLYSMNDLRPLNTLKPLQDLRGLQDVAPLSFTKQTKYNAKPITFIDSAEKANSLLDILGGPDQRQALLQDTSFESFLNTPLEIPASFVYHLYDAYVDPIVENGITSGQGWKEVGLNALTAMSENLDILSNLVKSQNPLAGGEFGSLETLSDALGLNGERVAYNFNTGYTLLDIPFEIISDPLTVLELATKAVEGVSKAGVKSTVQTTLQTTMSGLTEQEIKDFSKALTRAVVKHGNDTTFDTVLRYVNRRSLNAISTKVRPIYDDLLRIAVNSNKYRRMIEAAKIYKDVQYFDTVITDVARQTTPLGLAAEYAKKGIKTAAEHIYKSIRLKLTEYNLEQNFIRKGGAYTDALKTAMYKNKALNETIFKNNAKFFRALGIDEIQAQQSYYNMLLKANDRPITDITNTYLDQLAIDLGKNANTVKQFRKAYSTYISSSDFKELLSALSAGPVPVLKLEQEMSAAYHEASLRSMSNYINKNKNNLLDMYTYIDEHFLKYKDVHYGFKNFRNYLYAISTDPRVNKEYLGTIDALLGSVGINKNNAEAIGKILDSRIKDKNKALLKLINATNTGISLFKDVDYERVYTKIRHKEIDSISKSLNTLWETEIVGQNKNKYSEILNNSIKDIKDAATRISNNTDVEHALAYIRNTVRLQDLPNTEEGLYRLEYFSNATYNNKIFYNMHNDKKLLYDIPEDIIKKGAVKTKKGNSFQAVIALKTYLEKTTKLMDNLNDDMASIYYIPKWQAQLGPMLNLTGQLVYQLDRHGGPYAVKYRDVLYKVQHSLNILASEEIRDPLVNYISDITGLVQPQLSHKGMFDIMVQHTHLASDPNVSNVLEQFSVKDSVYRTQILPELQQKFRDAGLYAQAENINKVIAQVDTVTNLSMLLDADLNTPFKLSNKAQDDIKHTVFDIIINHSDYSITDIRTELVKKYSRKGLTPNTQYETLLAEIYSRIEGRGGKTIQERILKDTAELNQEYVYSKIEEAVKDLLDNYIKEQSKIALYLPNVSLATMYSKETTDLLNFTLGTEFALARNTDLTVEQLSAYKTFMRDAHIFSEGISSGIEDIEEKVKSMHIPIETEEAAAKLRTINESYNLLTSSVESGKYVNKYVIPKDFIKNFKLTPEDIVGSKQEYLLLVDRLNFYKDVLHEDYKYEAAYIDRIRTALIETYSYPYAIFAPSDPAKYFNNIDNQALLTWAVVTSGNLSINNKTRFYASMSEYLKLKDFKTLAISDDLEQLENVMRNKPFVDSERLSYLAGTARNAQAVEYANRIVKTNLWSTLHSLEDLGTHRADISKFIKDDVDAANDIIKSTWSLADLDNAIREDYDVFKNPDDLYKFTKSSYGYPDAMFGTQEQLRTERIVTLSTSFAESSPEQIATWLYRNCDGAAAFYNNNLVLTKNPDNTFTWSGLENPFNFTKKELKDAGLAMKQDGDWYYFHLTDDRVHNAAITFKPLPSTYENIHEKYNNLFNKYRIYLNMYNEDVPDNLLVAEPLNKDTWDTFLDKNSDFFGNIEERKVYQKLTPQGNSKFFDKSYSRINLSILGGYDAYNLWNSLYSDTFIPHSYQMSSNTRHGLLSFVHRSNKINKYLTMFFNKDYDLNNPLIETMFKDADDKRIAEFFDTDKYRVVILKQDKQKLPFVFEYAVHNKKDLLKAKQLNGILVPTETYTAIKQVVNKRQMTNSLLDVYRRVVPSTYKSMYLFTAGFPFRNAIDSLIYKNTNELGGIEMLSDVFKYNREASKALELHNKIQREVLTETAGETFNKSTLLKVLERHTQDEVDIYYLTDLFIESNASGGLSESMGSYLKEFNKKGVDDIRPLWEKVWEEKIIFGEQRLNPLYQMRELNNNIEQTARLGLFLASVDEGIPIPDAIDRVIKTHFDYSSSSDLLDVCERIFWFSTFPINNLNYYVGEGLTKSPSLLRLLFDVQTASWNNGEYTYEELKKTNFLAYHALAGNIRIGNWIIKVSPSVFDFIGLVTDLPGNIRDRLNPIVGIPFNLDNLGEELNPAQSQVRNIRKFFEEGNPIPSILSKINDTDFTRSLGKWRRKYSGTWTRYPKVYIPHAYIRYLRKYFARKYYTNVRRHNRVSLYHDAVKYYKVYRRGPTYYDL
jgi:hypothetical protein